MDNQHNDVKLAAITGRCGSTWLGAMVSSHPEVAYLFEPFHRLSKTQPAIALDSIFNLKNQ